MRRHVTLIILLLMALSTIHIDIYAQDTVYYEPETYNQGCIKRFNLTSLGLQNFYIGEYVSFATDGENFYIANETGIAKIDKDGNLVNYNEISNDATIFSILYTDGYVFAGAVDSDNKPYILKIDPNSLSLTASNTLGDSTAKWIQLSYDTRTGNLYAFANNVTKIYSFTISTVDLSIKNEIATPTEGILTDYGHTAKYNILALFYRDDNYDYDMQIINGDDGSSFLMNDNSYFYGFSANETNIFAYYINDTDTEDAYTWILDIDNINNRVLTKFTSFNYEIDDRYFYSLPIYSFTINGTEYLVFHSAFGKYGDSISVDVTIINKSIAFSNKLIFTKFLAEGYTIDENYNVENNIVQPDYAGYNFLYSFEKQNGEILDIVNVTCAVEKFNMLEPEFNIRYISLYSGSPSVIYTVDEYIPTDYSALYPSAPYGGHFGVESETLYVVGQAGLDTLRIEVRSLYDGTLLDYFEWDSSRPDVLYVIVDSGNIFVFYLYDHETLHIALIQHNTGGKQGIELIYDKDLGMKGSIRDILIHYNGTYFFIANQTHIMKVDRNGDIVKQQKVYDNAIMYPSEPFESSPDSLLSQTYTCMNDTVIHPFFYAGSYGDSPSVYNMTFINHENITCTLDFLPKGFSFLMPYLVNSNNTIYDMRFVFEPHKFGIHTRKYGENIVNIYYRTNMYPFNGYVVITDECGYPYNATIYQSLSDYAITSIFFDNNTGILLVSFYDPLEEQPREWIFKAYNLTDILSTSPPFAQDCFAPLNETGGGTGGGSNETNQTTTTTIGFEINPPSFNASNPSITSVGGILTLALFIGIMLVFSRVFPWYQALAVSSGVSLTMSVLLFRLDYITFFLVLFAFSVAFWRSR